ncbi:MAG: 30S ribosomal protein S8 [Desulfitobacteriaceae bacterium]|nr:30S ribosomal protein S8 [Desulfitobacteriaceae bacterium]MDD4346030.1 30S ribosomal protein S8 [Desulfitobacteriaceae bacterium]MDD4401416.1 30S ribosomal protein S8 [Desulfitobacteriaceae bacterium]
MSISDPIADLLTRIRNAGMVYHDKVELPASRVKRDICKLLKAEGFIKDVEYIADEKQGVLRLYLKYGANRERVITGLKRISRPGLRVYAKRDEIPKVLGGLGVAIVSTSKGIMSDKQARSAGLGGEVIAYIW